MQVYLTIQRIDDVIKYWKWKDKEKAKFRKEMLIQFQLEYYSVIESYLEL